jgi:hypothetical protein
MKKPYFVFLGQPARLGKVRERRLPLPGHAAGVGKPTVERR